jgi:succinylglutamate desuccinylase
VNSIRHNSNERHTIFQPISGIEGVYVATAKRKGPTVGIATKVHGNECASEIVLQNLLKNGIDLDCGRVLLLDCNPRAFEAKKRFIEVDLNRSFRELTPVEKTKKPEELPYEIKRAQELIPYLDQCDSLLDLHESHSSPIDPFIICELPSINLAFTIGARIIALNFTEAEPNGTDNWMQRHGKRAICYEVGYYSETAKNARLGMKAVARFLQAEKLTSDSLIPLFSRLHVRVVKARPGVKRGTEPFVFSRAYKSFDPLYIGEHIATHGSQKIVADEHGVIIFPNQDVKPGAEAFSFGEILEIKEVRALRKNNDSQPNN